jgi:hypothetical protein
LEFENQVRPASNPEADGAKRRAKRLDRTEFEASTSHDVFRKYKIASVDDISGDRENIGYYSKDTSRSDRHEKHKDRSERRHKPRRKLPELEAATEDSGQFLRHSLHRHDISMSWGPV